MSLYTTYVQSNSHFWVYRCFPPHVAARIPVSGNQTLSPVQIVAQTSHETGYEVVPIASALSINASDLDKSLSIQIGDLVRSGTILAERKKMFGRVTHVTSPVEGTAAEIQDGNLFIKRIPEDHNLRSLIHGKVLQVIPGKGVIIQAVGSRVQAAWSNGIEGAGNLKILSKSSRESLQLEHLETDLYGAIVTVGHIDQPQLLKKLVDAGASGLITGTASPDVFQAAKAWQLPFILTDRIGDNGIFPSIFKLLCENSRKHTALFSHEYGQSNRPEIVIVNQPSDEEALPPPNQHEKLPTSLKIRQKVRLLAEPHKGEQGIIKKTYHWPKTTSMGLKTEGADVEFENGEVAFVPTVNLDIIC